MAEQNKNNETQKDAPHWLGCVLGFFDRILSFVETAGLGVGFALMVGVVFAQGVLSKLLWFDWPWAEHLALQLMVVVVGLGAAVAVRERRHIAIDVVVRLLPVRLRALVAAAVAALCVVACRAIYGSAFGYYELYKNRFTDNPIEIAFHLGAKNLLFQVPLWWFRWLVLCALILIIVRFALVCVEEIAAVITGKPAREPEPAQAHDSSGEATP